MQFQGFDNPFFNDPTVERLPLHQLRTVVSFLWDGKAATIPILSHINATYKDGHRMFLWFVRNKIRGQAFVDFFKEHSNEKDHGGTISGIAYVRARMGGQRYSIDRLTVDDLLK